MATAADLLGQYWTNIEEQYTEVEIADLHAARQEINTRKAQALIQVLNQFGLVIPNTLVAPPNGGPVTGTGKIQIPTT